MYLQKRTLKKIALACGLAFLGLFHFSSYAQGEAEQQLTPLTEKRTIIKVTPQQFLRNTFQIGGEFFLSPSMNRSLSLYLAPTAGGGTMNNWSWNSYDYSETGISGELQYRYYASPFKTQRGRKDKPFQQGVYVAAYLRAEYFSNDYEVRNFTIFDPNTNTSITLDADINEKIFALNPGVMLGFQRTLWEHVVIDAYVGGGLRYTGTDNTTSLSDIPDFRHPWGEGIFGRQFQGMVPRFGLSVGVAF